MTTILKPQWDGIERTLRAGMVVRFKYNGDLIEVRKVAVSETKLAYVVSVDGCPLLGFREEDEPGYNPLASVFLRKRIFNPYAATIRRVSAKRGGKALLKRKENCWMLESKVEVTDTFFPTAKTIVSHFRKIKGLEIASPLSDMEVDNAAAC